MSATIRGFTIPRVDSFNRSTSVLNKASGTGLDLASPEVVYRSNDGGFLTGRQLDLQAASSGRTGADIVDPRPYIAVQLPWGGVVHVPWSGVQRLTALVGQTPEDIFGLKTPEVPVSLRPPRRAASATAAPTYPFEAGRAAPRRLPYPLPYQLPYQRRTPVQSARDITGIHIPAMARVYTAAPTVRAIHFEGTNGFIADLQAAGIQGGRVYVIQPRDSQWPSLKLMGKPAAGYEIHILTPRRRASKPFRDYTWHPASPPPSSLMAPGARPAGWYYR